MDHTTDFLTADFLYLTLFAQRNIVIYPFVLDQKLDGLKAILSIFYNVETFDIANMSGQDSIDLYFQIHQEQNAAVSDTKQSLIIFPNGCKDNFDLIRKYPAIRFISIETEIAPELMSPEFILYNKKSKQFEQWNRKSESNPNMDDAINWCHFVLDQISDNVISNLSTFTQNKDLTLFWTTTQEIYQCIAADQIAKIQQIKSKFESLEFNSMLYFIQQYYHINIPSIPSTIPISKESSSGTPGGNTDDVYSEIIAIKTASSPVYLALENMLSEIQLNENVKMLSPETKYLYLRGHDWVTGIPVSAMVSLLKIYLQERLKQTKIAPAGFEKFVYLEHKAILDAFALVNFDPKFKQKATIPIATFAKDPCIKSWLITTTETLPKVSAKAKNVNSVPKETPKPRVVMKDSSEYSKLPEVENSWQFEDLYQRKIFSIRQRLEANPLDYYAVLEQEFDRVMGQAKNKK